MRPLLSLVINASKMWLAVSPLKLKNTCLLLCTSSCQGDSTCNGIHSRKALLSDPQLFEDQFEELVADLTERDLNDPVLADALSRLREVCVSSCILLCVLEQVLKGCFSQSLYLHCAVRFWCTMLLEERGTEACL